MTDKGFPNNWLRFRLEYSGLWRPLLFFIVIFISLPAFSQIDHQLVRRLVVFPMKVEQVSADFHSSLSAGHLSESSIDDVWWQTREELTRNRRFLVASKQFLLKSDVFQSRGDLEPADALILGKLLDAHGLVTLQLLARKLVFTVYDGGNGLVLYKKTLILHPSLTATDQVASLARKVAKDFLAQIPYQGFTTVDSLIGQAVYQERDAKFARIDLGSSSRAQVGDLVQWIKLASNNSAALFQGGAKVTTFAEGKIAKIEDGLATVEIMRATSLGDIKEHAIVRVPREAERLISENGINDAPRATLTSELVSPEARPMEQVSRERKPLLATLSFVGSIAAFLLLAF